MKIFSNEKKSILKKKIPVNKTKKIKNKLYINKTKKRVYLYKSPVQYLFLITFLSLIALFSVESIKSYTNVIRENNKLVKYSSYINNDYEFFGDLSREETFFGTILSLLESHKFDFRSEHTGVSSSAVFYVQRENKKIGKYIGDNSYNSLYNLLQEFFVNENHKMVLESINTWLDKSQNKYNSIDTSEYGHYLDFLGKTYVRESVECFYSRRYICAKENSNYAGRLLRAANFPPNYFSHEINKILLYEVLMNDAEKMHYHWSDAESLIKVIDEMPYLDLNEDSSSFKDSFKNIADYLHAIQDYKNKKFNSAKDKLEKMKENDLPTHLSDLVSLMLVRVVFWSSWENDTYLDEGNLEIFRQSKQNLINYAYKDDIDYYIEQYIHNKNDERKQN